MGDDDETVGIKIVKKPFEYGYVKAKDDNFYQQKTSWCLTPYGYVLSLKESTRLPLNAKPSKTRKHSSMLSLRQTK